MTYEVRSLSDAEIDAVGGGNPVGAFAAGMVVGAGLACGAIAVVGGTILLAAAVVDAVNGDSTGGEGDNQNTGGNGSNQDDGGSQGGTGGTPS